MSITSLRPWSFFAFALVLACADDGVATDAADTETGSDTSGDGDGDPSGDGDGDPSGDGDGDPSGDGDGDPTGDGDGDPTGDGDGDPIPTEFTVGVDVRSIDPTPQQQGSVYLGGFGAPFAGGTVTGIHDSIYARSFAIGWGDDGVIFTVVDAIGMGNQWTRAIRSQAAALTGLSPERIIVASTHSHAGPDFQGLWGGVGDSYRTKVIADVNTSMLTAWQTRVPADLSVANSSADNRNRRGWEFTDDSMFLLQARRKSDESLLGTMVAFAAHPVLIGADNTEISRDYVGYAVDGFEATTGAPVMWFNGILGDVSPDVPEGTYADDFERADAYGSYLAAQAGLMLESAEPVDPDFSVDYAEWEMPVDNALFNLAGQLGILDYDFIQNGLSSSVITQTAYVRLGTQAQIIAFPGESLTRNGLAVKEAMTAPYQAVLGNAGDALGYFIPSDEWETGLNDNYEEGVSIGQSAGDTTRDVMVDLIEADVF
jgi:hypothetical protein